MSVVYLNGQQMYAVQYTKRLLLILDQVQQENAAARGIRIGQNYLGIDDQGQDILEDQGFIPFHGSVVPLEEEMWVVGPDPEGHYIPMSDGQYQLYFKE